MSFFSCYSNSNNKKSNKILVNPNVEWLKYTITNICTSIHVDLLVFCFTYISLFSISLSSVICEQSLNTQIRYIWQKRASFATLQFVYKYICISIISKKEKKIENITNNVMCKNNDTYLINLILHDIFMKIQFWYAFGSFFDILHDFIYFSDGLQIHKMNEQ